MADSRLLLPGGMAGKTRDPGENIKMLKTLLSGGLCCMTIVLLAQDGMTDEQDASSQTICFRIGGPDVIVGDIRGVSNYSAVDGVEAFAFGTESCNVGDEELLWHADTNEKPVIGQSVYQLNNGRFRMIGQGWLKHGFFALSDNFCGCGCSGTNGTMLGIGCSDLYSSGLNGQQSNMGGKWTVNAYSGYYPFPPPDLNNTGNGIYKRVQVKISDLDPEQDGGGWYFVEAQYVSPDDAEAGNGFNNASWKVVEVSGSGNSWHINPAFTSTVREQQVLQVWPLIELDATVSKVFVENEGLLLLGCKVYPLGDGTWQYEYVIQNYNSDRSISSFEIPLTEGALVTDIGFHDVPYHSGSPISGADWEATVNKSSIRWKCTETYEENEWANALRWGTAYNFYFTADVGPRSGSSTMGVFKPPSGNSKSMIVEADVRVPIGNGDPTGGCCIPGEDDCQMLTQADCEDQLGSYNGDWVHCAWDDCLYLCDGDTNGDLVVDVSDLLAVIADWQCEGSCSADVTGDGIVDVADLLLVIAGWGPC